MMEYEKKVWHGACVESGGSEERREQQPALHVSRANRVPLSQCCAGSRVSLASGCIQGWPASGVRELCRAQRLAARRRRRRSPVHSRNGGRRRGGGWPGGRAGRVGERRAARHGGGREPAAGEGRRGGGAWSVPAALRHGWQGRSTLVRADRLASGTHPSECSTAPCGWPARRCCARRRAASAAQR